VVRFVRPFACVFLSLFFHTAADASPVSGRVVDPDGKAVPGATVLLVTDGEPLRSVVTDARGAFTIEAPDRPFDLRVALAGFKGEATSVDPSTTEVGEIRLAVSGVTESVLVSAAQVEIPLSATASTVTIMTGEELRRQQIVSVADALRLVPGMTVAAAGGTGAVAGVFPRGGESNFTLVFVDDVPVTAFGGEFDFAHLTTNNVERIEIVRGPQSALFGSNAIGGVVRIVTRHGGAPAVNATIEAGSLETLRFAAAASGSTGRFEWGASGEHLGSEGLNGQQVRSGLTVENDDYRRSSGAVSAGWRNARATIRGLFSLSRYERGTPGPFGSNPIEAYTGIDTVSRGENRQATASVSAMVPLTSQIRAVTQLTHHRLDSDFASPFGPSESGSRRTALRSQLDFAVGPGLEMSSGFEFQGERAGSTFITAPASVEPVPVERTISAVFAEARWTRLRRLSVTAGARLDHVSRDAVVGLPDDSLVSVNPRAAVSWIARATDGTVTKVRGSVATGIRPPGAFDIAFTDNPSLKPERSVSVEAAVEQAFAGGRVYAEAIAFANEYDDLIVAVGSFQESSRYTTDNISNARARGLEFGLTLGHRFAARRPINVRSRVAYTMLDSEVLAVDRDDEAPPPFVVGDPLLRRPRHQFSAQLTADTGPFTAFIYGGARSRVLDVEPSLGTFGGLHYSAGFSTWTTGASVRIRRAEVFARIENLFDREYEEAFGFPAPGRRATLGLRVAAGR
jgi:outer membrane cobalamin receptor